MTILSLSQQDKKALERLYFIQWTIYKWMLITIGAVFGAFWLWVGWECLHDEQLRNVFSIITVIMLVLLTFGLISTPRYKRKVKQPLQEDIQQNQKIQKTGVILRIESAGRYNDNIIFLENGSTDPEVFVFNSKFSAVLIPEKEIILDHSPAARIVLNAQLLVPQTAEEIAERKESDNNALIAATGIACIILLGLGWMFNLLLPFVIICFVCVIVILLVKKYQ
jgi:hypothetical protein